MRKKREAERRREGIEMNWSRKEARIFYEKIKKAGMIGLWRDPFNGILNGDTNTDEFEPQIPITDDGIEIPSPDCDELCS